MDDQTQQQPNTSVPQVQPTHTENQGGAAGILKSLEDFFQKYLVDKAPFHLPEKAKETIVKISPWISLILLIIALPILLAAFGVSLILAPAYLMATHSFGANFWIAWLFILATVVLEAMAISPLMKRQIRGWRFVYWGMLLSVVSNILNVSVGGLVGNVIGLYILFQIKNKYQ
jgi:hypothetical protein